MKKNLVASLVCAIAIALTMNAYAQANKKPAKEKAHAHEEDHKHDEKHSDDHKHDEKDHEHEKDKAHEHKDEKAHAHPTEAPHGGTVVKLGKHAFNLEFVRDPDAGKFLVYVLDGHMEYVDVAEKSFDVVAKVKGKEHNLTLTRSGNAEKSSMFEGSADWIKSTKKFDGSISKITLKGKSFTDISFAFPKASKKAR